MSSYADTFSRVAKGSFEDASPEQRAEAAKEVIQMAAVASGAVAIQPIPLVDVALIAPIQIAMVQAIGRVYGYRLDKKSVLEILSSFGAGLVTQSVILAAAKFIPFLGWIISVPMAYALTWAVGEVSICYFKSGRGANPDELRSMFDRVYREKRAERSAAQKASPGLKTKLKDLVEAFEAGLITEDEFQQKKEAILREL